MTKYTLRAMIEARRQLAEELAFLDASVWLGRPAGFPLADELKPDALQDALRKHYIAGSLVSHWRSKTASAQEGNQALQDTTDSLGDNDFVIWTALPLYPAEVGPLPGITEVNKKVRGVRIFPVSHNFPLIRWSAGPLCEWLIEHKIPLFIWHVELDWTQLYELAREFPELKIVVETQTQKILYPVRSLFALMRDCPNVFVELSNFVGPGFIEYAVREFGPERLIFGSFMPVADPFVPMGMVLDADISRDDKKLIAGANLRRMIEEVRL